MTQHWSFCSLSLCVCRLAAEQCFQQWVFFLGRWESMTRKNMCEDPLEPGPLSFPQLSMPPHPPSLLGGVGGAWALLLPLMKPLHRKVNSSNVTQRLSGTAEKGPCDQENILSRSRLHPGSTRTMGWRQSGLTEHQQQEECSKEWSLECVSEAEIP